MPALEAKEGVRPLQLRWSSESWSQVRTPRDRSLQVGVEAILVRFCIRAAAARGKGKSDKRGPNSCAVVGGHSLYRRPPSMSTSTSPERGI